MSDMNTFSDLIDRFGVEDLAELLQLPESHIRVMKTRNSIGTDHWPALVRSGRKWLTVEVLFKLRAARFADSAPRPRGTYKRKLEKCA